jgi:hypothetical protein
MKKYYDLGIGLLFFRPFFRSCSSPPSEGQARCQAGAGKAPPDIIGGFSGFARVKQTNRNTCHPMDQSIFDCLNLRGELLWEPCAFETEALGKSLG